MKNAGIWIDQREANIIRLEGDSFNLKTIYSEVESRVRIEGEKKEFGRFGDQYLIDEKGKKNRMEESMNRFLNMVIKELEKSDNIMIFGPAQTKLKLEKRMLENPELSLRLKETLTSENMTENQKVAYVRKYFTGT